MVAVWKCGCWKWLLWVCLIEVSGCVVCIQDGMARLYTYASMAHSSVLKLFLRQESYVTCAYVCS
jgi:hypothetical protein